MKSTKSQMNPSRIAGKCSTVTKFIRANTDDKQVELMRGNGYFYFSGGYADGFKTQGVYTNTMRYMTLRQWLDEYLERRKSL